MTRNSVIMAVAALALTLPGPSAFAQQGGTTQGGAMQQGGGAAPAGEAPGGGTDNNLLPPKGGAHTPALSPGKAGQPPAKAGAPAPAGETAAPRAEPNGKPAPAGKAPAGETKGTQVKPAAGEAKPGAPASANAPNQRQGAGRAQPPRIDREHQVQFRTAIRGLGIRPVTNVNFSLRIGIAVPRTIELHRLPPSIIEVYPAYEGFEFFLVRGDIVVVDPETLEIVAVFPA